MATLEWPYDLRPATLNWDLKSNGTIFQSPFNGATQTIRYPGSAWVAEMTFSALDDFEAREMEALLFQLDGYAGRVKLRDYGRIPAVKKGSPVVSLGNQTGTLLQTKGWTPNTVVLKKGDYFTVNDELKYVIADVTSSSTGTAQVGFAPMMRRSPALNAALEIENPYGVFRVNKDTNGVQRKPAFNNDFSLNFIEAF